MIRSTLTLSALCPTIIAFISSYYNRSDYLYGELNESLNINICKLLLSNITNMSNFHPLEVVGRGSHPQLQVGDNLNKIPWRKRVNPKRTTAKFKWTVDEHKYSKLKPECESALYRSRLSGERGVLTRESLHLSSVLTPQVLISHIVVQSTPYNHYNYIFVLDLEVKSFFNLKSSMLVS